MNTTEICVIGEYPCTVKQFLSLDCRTPLEDRTLLEDRVTGGQAIADR